MSEHEDVHLSRQRAVVVTDVDGGAAAQLRIAQRVDRCTVLGPGTRAVLWVQGCSLACPGCVVPDTHAPSGGWSVSVSQLVRELSSLEVDGLTLSGGEPMQQAAPLVALVDSLRARRDWSVMAYTGYTLDHIERRGSVDQRALLARLDLLVDGPYVAARHTDLRWRGSDNQQVHFLTDRHRHVASRLQDRGVWMQVVVEDDGVFWMGIPPRGFRVDFERALVRRGLVEPRVVNAMADGKRSPKGTDEGEPDHEWHP